MQEYSIFLTDLRCGMVLDAWLLANTLVRLSFLLCQTTPNLEGLTGRQPAGGYVMNVLFAAIGAGFALGQVIHSSWFCGCHKRS